MSKEIHNHVCKNLIDEGLYLLYMPLIKLCLQSIIIF